MCGGWGDRRIGGEGISLRILLLRKGLDADDGSFECLLEPVSFTGIALKQIPSQLHPRQFIDVLPQLGRILLHRFDDARKHQSKLDLRRGRRESWVRFSFLYFRHELSTAVRWSGEERSPYRQKCRAGNGFLIEYLKHAPIVNPKNKGPAQCGASATDNHVLPSDRRTAKAE